MRITGRARDIIEMNTTNQYIPLVVNSDGIQIFPMYFAHIIEENKLAFPVTGATGIDDVLKKSESATAFICDRAGGYEAYELKGIARYITDEHDYQLVAEMRNVVPEFPIHAAVLFEVHSVHLIPPP